MPSAVITPCRLEGSVQVPPSKSMAHRFLLAAGLAEGVSRIGNLALSQDVEATLSCLEVLGAGLSWEGDGSLLVRGTAGRPAGGDGLPTFQCGESGSTLRFFLPVALAVAGGGRFAGRGRLMQRPMEPYERALTGKGVRWSQQGDTLSVEGTLPAGRYELPGDVSSQFVTGLLYALPLTGGTSELVLASPLESAGYVDMTLQALAQFGVRVERKGERFLVPGGQVYRPGRAEVPGDWSQGAIWYAANFLDHRVDIRGLDAQSSQGDRQIASLYWQLARPGDRRIDVSQCPDLAPALGAMAAVARGSTTLTGCGRLRMKESDRLSAIAAAVNALGGDAEEGEDTLTIRGAGRLRGGCAVDSRGDHRIAMMAAILATRCREPVTVTGMDCVSKSYPDFWAHFAMLGGEFHVV